MWEYLPVLLLLACPLMMIFMMRGMGGMNHGSNSQHNADDKPDPAKRIAALEAEVAALRSQQSPTVDRDSARST